VKILGVDLPQESSTSGPVAYTLMLLDESGHAAEIHSPTSLPELAALVGKLTAGNPFLLGVNIPVVVPAKQVRTRRIENLVNRRLGFRAPPGGRGHLSATAQGVLGETLLAGLAAAGQPCLPYPDRDRHTSGLAESYAGLSTKALLWEHSPFAGQPDRDDRAELFKAYKPPAYRVAQAASRTRWAERAIALDQVLRLLDAANGFDLRPAREALASAGNAEDVEQAGALLDAALIAGVALRYLEEPQNCLFAGDPESGYMILPADSFIRRLFSETRKDHGRLFPQASLHDRLAGSATIRAVELLTVPGRPQRFEVSFSDRPHYEFDNLDEMLWWKHTRHLDGPILPIEGLLDLQVSLGPDDKTEANGTSTLKLVRSRHKTLSFRFDPPSAWRRHVPTRDGRSYSIRILRATYETLPE
jgi:predicted RNase H-like nuclease